MCDAAEGEDRLPDPFHDGGHLLSIIDGDGPMVKNEDGDLEFPPAVGDHIDQHCFQIQQGGVGKQESGDVLYSQIQSWAEKI
jgi:hypothetical protein